MEYKIGAAGVFHKRDDFVQFYQQEFSNVPYCGETLETRGCGPTAMAMVLSNLSGKYIDPKEAAWTEAYSVIGVGTDWTYFSATTNHFNNTYDLGIKCTQTYDINQVVNALRNGAMAISSQRPGLFCEKGGHFITLARIDGNGGITVLDPVIGRAEGKGYNFRMFSAEEINQGAKCYWIFEK